MGIFFGLLPEQQLISLNLNRKLFRCISVLWETPELEVRVQFSLGIGPLYSCISVSDIKPLVFKCTYLKREPPRCKYGFPSSSLFFAKHRRMKIIHIKLIIGITTFFTFQNWVNYSISYCHRIIRFR